MCELTRKDPAVHAPDGTELLLCLPAGDQRPLDEAIAAHLDGLITGSGFTPMAHLITTDEHHDEAHGPVRLDGGGLICHALPARCWLPGPLIRALAGIAADSYRQWDARYGHLPPAVPVRCLLPFAQPIFSPIDVHHAVNTWTAQPQIAALRADDPNRVPHYSGARLEAITAGLATYTDYIIGTQLLPDALITTDRQIIATALDRSNDLVTLREVMAHRDQVCAYLSTVDGDVTLATVAVGDHDADGCICAPPVRLP
jgi:hypothetical protein